MVPRTDQAAELLGGPSSKIGQVIFNGDGTLVLNGHAVPINLKPVVRVGSIGAGGDLAFPAEVLPPELRSTAADLQRMGSVNVALVDQITEPRGRHSADHSWHRN